MNNFSKSFLIAALVGLFCSNIHATALGDLAASMKAGEWRQLATTNMPTALAANGSSGGIMGYADGGAWDSKNEKLYFVGSDHCETARFVSYDAKTNAWSRLAQPSWVDPAGYCGGMTHGYDCNTINVGAGTFYFRGMGGQVVYTYNIAGGTWSSLPANNNFYSVAFGMSYFPEAHGLFVADMQLGYAFIGNDITNQWKTLSSTLANTAGCYHSISEYNPVHKVVIFGGGNGNRTLYKVDSLQKITRLKDSPVDLSCSGLASLLTVDPVSGDYLVITSDGQFHAYDVLSDTWRTLPGSNFFGSILGGSGNGAVWDVVATPISNYGVVMFSKDNMANSMVYLYKHASGAKIDGQKLNPQANEGLKVMITPNPFSSSAAISFPLKGNGKVSAKIFNIQGKVVADLSSGFSGSNRMVWDAGTVPAGIYLLSGNIGNEQFSKTLFLRK